ncbi:MAG TPA: hypothetical protein VHN80_05080 [Kineosporiaceae bacterium]|jgi:hypothetical protein|nr:hypothetical protein [Kineosporiaceae bacterium]
MRIVRSLAVAGVLAAGLGLGPASPSSAASNTSDVSILHGIPGLTVDVYANGNKLTAAGADGGERPAPPDHDIHTCPAEGRPGPYRVREMTRLEHATEIRDVPMNSNVVS